MLQLEYTVQTGRWVVPGVGTCIYKHTHLIFYPLLNWKPVQKVANCGSNAVMLPLA